MEAALEIYSTEIACGLSAWMNWSLCEQQWEDTQRAWSKPKTENELAFLQPYPQDRTLLRLLHGLETPEDGSSRPRAGP